MDSTEARKIKQLVGTEVQKTKKFLECYQANREKQDDLQAFDSMINHPKSEISVNAIPKALVDLLNSRAFKDDKDGHEAIFDGLNLGILEYQKRNGGDQPTAQAVLSAFYAAQAFTELTKDDTAKQMFDSLNFGHHEALSMVHDQVKVTILMSIANSLPIVAQLPNVMGSNEVPIIYGRVTAANRIGALKPGDFADGANAGYPFIENNHVIRMIKSGASFQTPIHVGSKEKLNADKTVQFEADTNTPKAPFLGGRVTILVKGIPVANDFVRSHPVTSGVSMLQPLGEAGVVVIGGKEYKVQSGEANLTDHTVSVTFDGSKTEPEDGDVEVQVFFDYERKDPSTGEYLLKPPGLDMTFERYSVYATPMRSVTRITIDAMTQMQNELGISWHGSVLAIVQQRKYLEEMSRLLRGQLRSSMASPNHVHTFDTQKTGLSFTNMETMFSTIKATIGRAKAKLSTTLNRSVGGVDIFVSDMGAAFFNALPSNIYTPTGLSYGENSSIYRIGTLNDGTHVYYLPKALGVFDESGATNTASALMLPRPSDPTLSPFVGHVAVPMMAVNAKPETFEEQVAVYSRTAAERNPHKDLNNQGMLIQFVNIPNI